MQDVVVGAGDAAIREEANLAVWVADAGDAQTDFLDVPEGAVDLDQISHDVLAFHDDEEARHHIADEVLRAEADRESHHARAQQHRVGIEVQLFLDDHHRCDEDDDVLGNAERQKDECGHPLAMS